MRVAEERAGLPEYQIDPAQSNYFRFRLSPEVVISAGARVKRPGEEMVGDAVELVARHSEAQTGCPITYTFSRRSIRRLLESYGFRVTEMQIDHIFPYRIADYVRYRYVKSWPWRAVPRPVFRWLERHFGWHLCVTAEKVGSSAREPLEKRRS